MIEGETYRSLRRPCVPTPSLKPHFKDRRRGRSVFATKFIKERRRGSSRCLLTPRTPDERDVLSDERGFRWTRISSPVVYRLSSYPTGPSSKQRQRWRLMIRREEDGDRIWGNRVRFSLALTPPIFASFNTHLRTYTYKSIFDWPNPIFYSSAFHV